MFKIAGNHPKKYHLCQKPAKSGSARIWKCVLTSPSGGYLCNLGHKGFQNCGKLLIKQGARTAGPAGGCCCAICNVIAYSNILGKAIWLTISLKHL